jgi:hypothetical protein
MKITGYVLTILGTVIGGFIFFDTMVTSETIPQQQVGILIALTFAVMPYIFARAIEKISEPSLTDALDKFFTRRQVAPPTQPPVALPGLSQPSRRP